MGINEIADPINTILIVDIIGVTLFLEKDEKNKHKDETVNITKLEKTKPRKNLQIISSSDRSNIPLWNTINSPSPKIKYDTNKLNEKKEISGQIKNEVDEKNEVLEEKEDIIPRDENELDLAKPYKNDNFMASLSIYESKTEIELYQCLCIPRFLVQYIVKQARSPQ